MQGRSTGDAEESRNMSKRRGDQGFSSDNKKGTLEDSINAVQEASSSSVFGSKSANESNDGSKSANEPTSHDNRFINARRMSLTKPKAELTKGKALWSKLKGENLEKLYLDTILDQSSSYDVEKWVKKIFHLDVAGAVAQLKKLGVWADRGLDDAKESSSKDYPFSHSPRKPSKASRPPSRTKGFEPDLIHQREFKPEERRKINSIMKQRVRTLLAEVEEHFAGGSTNARFQELQNCDTKVSHDRHLTEVRLLIEKRRAFKHHLQKSVLKFEEEAEAAIFQDRAEKEAQRQQVADLRWDVVMKYMADSKLIRLPNQKEKSASRLTLGGGVQLKKENTEKIKTLKIASLYGYIDQRNKLDYGSTATMLSKIDVEGAMRTVECLTGFSPKAMKSGIKVENGGVGGEDKENIKQVFFPPVF